MDPQPQNHGSDSLCELCLTGGPTPADSPRDGGRVRVTDFHFDTEARAVRCIYLFFDLMVASGLVEGKGGHLKGMTTGDWRDRVTYQDLDGRS